MRRPACLCSNFPLRPNSESSSIVTLRDMRELLRHCQGRAVGQPEPLERGLVVEIFPGTSNGVGQIGFSQLLGAGEVAGLDLCIDLDA